MTETYRAGARANKDECPAAHAWRLLEDILLPARAPGTGPQHRYSPELERMADAFDFAWIEHASAAWTRCRPAMRAICCGRVAGRLRLRTFFSRR